MLQEDAKPNRSAIVGIGSTDYSTESGRSVLSLAVECCRKAMEEAGLHAHEVDGVLTFNAGDSVSTEAVANSLGLPELNYVMEWYAGGFAPSALVQLAGMLTATGTCKSVLIFRAMNGRSGYRLGGTDWSFKADGMWQYRMPYGYLTYPQTMAMWCRRHMIQYGTTSEQLASIAINQRKNALFNEKAMMRESITLDDYFNFKIIVEPFRVLDLCLETDGGCALLVTSAERAEDCKRKPVFIKAAAYVGGPGIGSDWADFFLWDDLTVNFTVPLGKKLFRQAGLTSDDIDVAQIYDCFTHTVILGLEGLGFCKKGEGGSFAASGETALSGTIPVNTGGGMLSEAYIHGMNVIAEAVVQLRGMGNDRQVQHAKHAIVTSGAWQAGSGMILTNEKGT